MVRKPKLKDVGNLLYESVTSEVGLCKYCKILLSIIVVNVVQSEPMKYCSRQMLVNKILFKTKKPSLRNG